MMERPGIKAFMLMLTAVGVIAPAAEWMKPATAANAEIAITGEVKPIRSATALKDALVARRGASAGSEDSVEKRLKVSSSGRSPFDVPTFSTPVGSIEETLPIIELLGIIQTPDGSVATLMIDGATASLRVGESSGRVKLQSVTLPDKAVVVVGKKVLAVRVP